jgi:hypothetical protein
MGETRFYLPSLKIAFFALVSHTAVARIVGQKKGPELNSPCVPGYKGSHKDQQIAGKSNNIYEIAVDALGGINVFIRLPIYQHFPIRSRLCSSLNNFLNPESSAFHQTMALSTPCLKNNLEPSPYHDQGLSS